MKTARLQVRVDRALKKSAEDVASARHTTLSALVTQFLLTLVEHHTPKDTTCESD